MVWIQFLAVVAVLVVATAVLAWRRRHVGRRVIVRLDDCTIEGRLISLTRRSMAFRNSRIVEQAKPVDGELVVERARVIWVQVLP